MVGPEIFSSHENKINIISGLEHVIECRFRPPLLRMKPSNVCHHLVYPLIRSSSSNIAGSSRHHFVLQLRDSICVEYTYDYGVDEA